MNSTCNTPTTPTTPTAPIFRARGPSFSEGKARGNAPSGLTFAEPSASPSHNSSNNSNSSNPPRTPYPHLHLKKLAIQ
jgi:hypothetical protein